MKTKIIGWLKTNWILLVILVLAAFLRLWQLSSNPPSLTPDEASLGYNAYSILKTGKDEYGQVFPVIFKSFGDYKPGLYVYLTVPSIALFGLTEFAVRFPCALAGIISVALIYLLVNILFKNKKLALLSAFIAAVTPWLIYFSRGAWEVNVALTLTLAGMYVFLVSLEKNKYLPLSALLFSLTLVTYQGAKLSAGIALGILVLVFIKKVLTIEKKYLVMSLVVGLLVSSPIILSMFQGKAGRLAIFSVFSYSRPEKYLQDFLDQGSEKVGDLSYYLFHSENLNFARGIAGRYFNHFSGKFLFFEGDWANPRHSAPYQGVFLLSDILLVVFGFYYFFKNGWKKEYSFVWLWLLLAPLPSVLSRDQIHAVRSLTDAIPFIIFLSFGLSEVLNHKYFKYLYVPVFLVSFTYFLDAYLVHLPIQDARYWDYGYKQVVETVLPLQKNYKIIKFQQSYAQPYIFFLFYGKYDPVKYQSGAKLVSVGDVKDVGQVEKIDNIVFTGIDWSVNRGDKGVLIIADTVRIPPEDSKDTNLFKIIKDIKYPKSEDTVWRIIEVLK